MSAYRDPVIAKLIDLFNASGPAVLKNRWYHGDPLLLPKSALPAGFITKDTTSIGNLDSADDESNMSFVINVVYDLTRDFGQALDNSNSSSALYELVEGRNADYTLKPDCLTYILRANQSLDADLWINMDEPVEPDYGVGVEKRGQGIYTVEAVIRLRITHTQLRPGL